MLLHAIDNLALADNSAVLCVYVAGPRRMFQAVERLEVSAIKIVIVFLARMDQHGAAIARPPRPVLDILVSVDYEPRPRLHDG